MIRAVGSWRGCGQVLWASRLTCHLVYFRLITRGADRRRRTGFSRARSRLRNVRHSAGDEGSSVEGSRGKSALLGDRLTHDPQGRGEADPVRVVSGVLGGFGHQRPDGVVAAQMTPNLLEY